MWPSAAPLHNLVTENCPKAETALKDCARVLSRCGSLATIHSTTVVLFAVNVFPPPTDIDWYSLRYKYQRGRQSKHSLQFFYLWKYFFLKNNLEILENCSESQHTCFCLFFLKLRYGCVGMHLGAQIHLEGTEFQRKYQVEWKCFYLVSVCVCVIVGGTTTEAVWVLCKVILSWVNKLNSTSGGRA